MFAHRKHVINSYEKVEDEFFLHTADGEFQGSKDDYLATNVDGDKFIISEEYAAKLMSIELSSQHKRRIESPFTEQQKIEMANGCGMSPNESISYIKGLNNGWDNFDRCTVGKK